MRIGLLSDTHSFLDDKVFTHFAECDEIWHAGDVGNIDVLDRLAAFKPLRGVYGNIDGQEIRSVFPETLDFKCGGLRVAMIHIGGYPGKYSPKARTLIQASNPDLFICGHSHIVKVMKDPKQPTLLHLNPGAAGREGFHKVKTLMRFSILDGLIKDLQLIELGGR